MRHDDDDFDDTDIEDDEPKDRPDPDLITIEACASCGKPGLIQRYMDDTKMIQNPRKKGIGVTTKFWVTCGTEKRSCARNIEEQGWRLKSTEKEAVEIFNDYEKKRKARIAEKKKAAKEAEREARNVSKGAPSTPTVPVVK